MNGNTIFNLRFLTSACSVCVSRLGSPRHFGRHLASERHIFCGLLGDFHPTILRTWLQKNTLFIQNRGHSEVLKKTPSSAKYVRWVRPPMYPRAPQYPIPSRRGDREKSVRQKTNGRGIGKPGKRGSGERMGKPEMRDSIKKKKGTIDRERTTGS